MYGNFNYETRKLVNNRVRVLASKSHGVLSNPEPEVSQFNLRICSHGTASPGLSKWLGGIDDENFHSFEKFSKQRLLRNQ